MGQLTDIFNKARERDKMVQYANKYKAYIATITMTVKDENDEEIKIDLIHPILAESRNQACDMLKMLTSYDNFKKEANLNWILDYSNRKENLSKTVLDNIAKCNFKLESNLGEEGVAYVIN